MPKRGDTSLGSGEGVFKRLGAVLVAGALAVAGPRALSAQAPDEAWRTLETEHFRVTFP